MSSINDWESLMNGVFGSGGRFRSSASAPKEEKKSSDAGHRNTFQSAAGWHGGRLRI